MVNQPSRLPGQHNPLLESHPDREPTHARHTLTNPDDQLVKKCRTQTVIFPGPKNLDIVRLKCPTPNPQASFLIRRSDNDSISVKTMFVLAFPDATEDDRKEEMIHVEHSYSSFDPLDGPWISSEDALKLSEEYGIVPYVKALLEGDPTVLKAKPSSSPSHSSPQKRIPSTRKSIPKTPSTASSSRVKSDDDFEKSHSNGISRKGYKAPTLPNFDFTALKKDKADSCIPFPHIAESLKSNVLSDRAEGVISSVTSNLPSPSQIKSDLEKAKAQVAKAQKSDAQSLKSLSLSKSSSEKRKSRDEIDNGRETKKSRVVEELENRVARERRKVRALYGLVLGFAASSVLPYIL
ncbi:Bouquet formation protein 4 [Neolecta irregularis DAH-3]|uniref:Bouquet formation protein 4 n=1 Tax=Neolecta irregularis (strain DAH-3) TaxID=1198029 RepID=A0A1U7LHC5_NEOID|nr:Bouquet formation protein 4 [Neolecta irregularis DAH-3]|eukprot:OLL22060.1 Bouquet formation protein 4 [Neolecta irregularis DAH-3]